MIFIYLTVFLEENVTLCHELRKVYIKSIIIKSAMHFKSIILDPSSTTE